MKTIKKLTQTLFLVFSFTFSNAQNKATVALIESIKSDYVLEDNLIIYQQIFEFSGKSDGEIFDSALGFLENYTDSKININSNDVNRGKIKAWGFLKEYNKENAWGVETTIGASYNISVDIKDTRVRFKIVLADYFKKEDGGVLSNALSELASTTNNVDLASTLAKTSAEVNTIEEGDLKIISTYPFEANSGSKNIWGRSFYLLNNHIKKILVDFPEYMKKNINDKW